MSFEIDERIFNEGGKADRFWVIHTGSVALDAGVIAGRLRSSARVRLLDLYAPHGAGDVP